MTAGDQTVQIASYLIQLGDKTNILVDTGFPAEVESFPGMEVASDRDVVAQLAALDLRPDDIDTLVCSHFDPDHCGQHAAFARAELVVQREHDELARGGDERFEGARPLWENPDLRYRTVDGDIALVPGVDLIESGGHVADRPRPPGDRRDPARPRRVHP